MQHPTHKLHAEKRLLNAIEAAGIGILEYNMQTQEIFCNQATKQLLGVEAGTDLTKEFLRTVVYPEDIGFVRDFFTKAVDSSVKKAYDITFRIINLPSVPLRWIRSLGMGFFDEDNKPLRFISTLVDVTNQKNIEEALRRSSEQFKNLADSLPLIVWKALPDGSIDYFNEQWYHYTGFEKGNTEKDCTSILHPDDYSIFVSTWKESVQTGKIFQLEYRLQNGKSGNYRWFLGRAYPVKDERENIIKWFGTCTDIHNQKTIMEELKRGVEIRTQELLVANNQLEQFNQDLARKNQELEQLTWIASHDLKEPLRKIKTYLSALEAHWQNQMDEVSGNYIEKIKLSANRMNQLITEVLNYSHLKRMENSFVEIDLNDLMEEVVNDLELMITQKKASIRWSPLPKVYGIRLQIVQLFSHLLHNALKFSKANVLPHIEINSRILTQEEVQSFESLNPKISYYEITISDNGIGFDRQYNEKVFGIFQRLPSSFVNEGTGIGLSLCKKIAHNHFGELLASSEPGTGTKMILLIPVAQ